MSVSSVKEKVRAVIGENATRKFSSLKKQLKINVLKTASRSSFLAKIYTLFFTNDYDREILGVICGHISHIENKSGAEPVNYFLRRGVHRVEKGLSMQPVRDVFGLDYIFQTVKAYEDSLINYRLYSHEEELKWAHDVLGEYFRVSGKHPIVDKAKALYELLPKPEFNEASHRGESSIPYPKSNAAAHKVTYEEFYQLSLSRRSVRWYQDRQLSRGVVDQAIQAASLSPSACNRQPYEFRVIDDVELLAEARSLPMGIKGFAHNIPVLIAVVGKLRAYPEARDRHVIYVDGGLAAMSLMYAFETLGVSTCPINWPDIKLREERAMKVLSLKPDERIVMWVSAGYASSDGMIPRSSKVSLANIRKYN